MTNGSTQHNSNTTAAAAQKASFCFCISEGDTRQSPSVNRLQLTDLTASFRR